MDDDALIKILTSPPTPRESAEETVARKERVLGAVFSRFSVVEARGMWLRVSRLRTGDPVSEAFGRFPIAMRQRLMDMLIDERRLKAIASRAR